MPARRRPPVNGLFTAEEWQGAERFAPLASRMRRRTLDEFLGQDHVVGPGRMLRRAIDADRLRRFYDRYAAAYDGWMRVYDRLLLGDGRWRTGERASGDTLELAIGTGLNLPAYPRTVRLTGLDLSPRMLRAARRRANALGRQPELILGDAQALPFPDATFDTVVATLLLSTIPDCWRTATEAQRVLKTSGQLLLVDHVRSPLPSVRWAERMLDPIVSPLTGVHLLRDPLDYLAAAGFEIESCARSRWGLIQEVVARKRSGR